MKKFISVISLNDNQIDNIKKEVALTKRAIESKTLNDLLKDNYNVLTDSNISKNILLEVFTNLVNKSKKPKLNISKQWIQLLESVDKIIKLLYNNNSTLEKVLTEFRRVIKEKYGDDSELYKQSIYKTGISQAESLQKKKDYKDSVLLKNLNRDDLEIFYTDEIENVIYEMSKSSNFLKKTIAVLLSTGSRLIEVLKVGKFEIVDENHINFSSLAKNDDNSKIVKRPLNFLNSKEVIDLINQIRNGLRLDDDNKIISDRYNSQINRFVKKLFLDRPLTTHKLRYIAANIAYILHGGYATPNSWIQQYLGHRNGETTKTYENINIKLRNTNIKEKEEIKEEIKEEELINENNFRNPRHREPIEKKFERMDELKAYLKTKNITAGNNIFRKYGYGAMTINAYNKL